MELLIALVISIVFTLALRTPLKRWPVPFYVLAIIMSVVSTSGAMAKLSLSLFLTLHPYLQRCWLAFGLFTIVMFIGVLPEHAQVRNYLMPIRGSLSIIAAILCTSHFVGYLNSYFERLLSGFTGMSAATVLSLVISWVLIGLLALLTITSFTVVRTRMKARSWKKLQKLSYVFYLLVFLHIGLLLAPSSAMGGNSLIALVIYTCICALYAVLKLGKWCRKPSESVLAD